VQRALSHMFIHFLIHLFSGLLIDCFLIFLGIVFIRQQTIYSFIQSIINFLFQCYAHSLVTDRAGLRFAWPEAWWSISIPFCCCISVNTTVWGNKKDLSTKFNIL